MRRGTRVEIREREGHIEIHAATIPMALMKRGKGSVAVPEDALPPLTDEMVRDTLERTRR